MQRLIAAIDAAAEGSEAYRRHDLRGSAYSCRIRAESLAEKCGGASTPALAKVSFGKLPLTARELEIVRLVGAGLSSRAVGLTLSVRTVEGHIYHAMAKTGVNSRDELAALLPRRESFA